MLNASPRFRYYLAFTLLLLLGAFVRLSAAPGPAASTPAKRAVEYTRYLTNRLRLLPHQFRPVHRCTRQQLAAFDSLAARPAATPADYARAEARYAAALRPWLSAGQFNAFQLLRERQPAEVPAAAVALRR